MPATPDAPKYEFMSYAEFGIQFFEHAVSVERISANFADMAGEESTIGPISADPIGVVKVVATTRTGTPQVKRVRHRDVKYTIAIPIELDLKIEIAKNRPKLTLGGLLPDINLLGGKLDSLQNLNYRGDVTVNLALTARAAKPLRIVIDIEQPKSKSVDVDIKADGVLASLLQQGGILEGEIRKAVAKEVRHQLESPKIQKGLVIDVAAEMDESQ